MGLAQMVKYVLTVLIQLVSTYMNLS